MDKSDEQHPELHNILQPLENCLSDLIQETMAAPQKSKLSVLHMQQLHISVFQQLKKDGCLIVMAHCTTDGVASSCI